jgi:hypothetical protein
MAPTSCGVHRVPDLVTAEGFGGLRIDTRSEKPPLPENDLCRVLLSLLVQPRTMVSSSTNEDDRW